jgi:Xaa-Pro aminopeptidase
MQQEGIDAFLVTRREDVHYLSGFTGSAGSLLVAFGKPFLITDFRYKLQARNETTGVSVLIQKTDFGATLGDVAKRVKAKQIFFDESALTVALLKKLKKKGLTLIGSKDLVGKLRQRKDEYELRSIRLAIKRAEESFQELTQYIKPGITEQEIGLKLEFLMREKGSRKPAFDTIVASAANGAMPHASITNRRIRKGDLVTIDFGAEANGYFSDITRTLCVGRPTQKQQKIHALVLEAQTAAIRSIKPGASCKSIDSAARSVIQKAGHGKHFGHGTGHGIGLMVHEGPSVSRLSQDQVEPGMVFSVEPGVYVPGWGGIRIEDLVLVTETGAKVLTRLPREL